MVLHVSVEPDECAKRVAEANFPSVAQVDTVEEVNPDLCREWAGKASTAKLVIVGAGPGPPAEGLVDSMQIEKGPSRTNAVVCMFWSNPS